MLLIDPSQSLRRDPAPWRPPAGRELLQLLRGERRNRPVIDPNLAGGLRAWLEDGLFEVLDRGRTAPLILDKATVARCGTSLNRAEGISTELLRGALVAALFRQQVTLGPSATPMVDALAALEADPGSSGLVAAIDALDPVALNQLSTEVNRHGSNLAERWPTIPGGWLPRTAVPLRARLAGGSVVLVGRADLLLGGPATTHASRCLVQVRSSPLHPLHREELHFLALLETLRSGAAPFQIATYSTLSGELEVEPVTDELLGRTVEATIATVAAHREDAPR